MAITRTQIARQLYQGGGGADFGDPGKAKERADRGYGNVDASGKGGKAASKDFDRNKGPGKQKSSVYGKSGPYDQETAKKAAIAQGKFKKKNPIQKTFDFLNKTYGKSLYNRFPNNPKNELAFLKNLSPSQRALLSPALKAKLEALDLDEDQDLLDTANTKFTFEEFQDLVNFQPTEGLNFADYAATYAGAPGLKYSGNVGGLEKYVIGKDEFGRTMYGYREERGGGRDDSILPVSQPVASIPEPTGYVNPLSLLSPRIAGTRFLGTEFEDEEDTESAANGGRIGAMGGGIMNVEDLDREAFFFGGIAKGLKKAVRGVKKLVKSPIGKIALGAAAFQFGGGLGGIMDKFNSLSKLQKFGIGVGVPSILAGLMTPKEDDNKFDLASYYASGQTGDVNPYSRIIGSKFDFYGGAKAADGGLMRANYQEGGDAEPVAKKTMPLLDMDGQEKDYRETGGFVDMGRMERADDVPARLSKNEFVFTADAVRNAGEGDIDKGAEVMYNMMKNLESGGEVSEESQGLDGAREMFQTSQRLGEVI